MNIGSVIAKEKEAFLYQEDPSLILNDQAVGVELELENIKYAFSRDRQPEPVITSRFYKDEVTLPSLGGLWYVVKDGSLRNGTEFVFSQPMVGANITLALSKMQDFIDEYRLNGSTIKISDRCSVHVHLDVRDLDAKQLYNLILTYILVEKVLFNFVNPERYKNNYCRPLTDSSFKFVYQRILKNSSTQAFEEDKIDSMLHSIQTTADKYSALNILPVAKYGSVEFRHHRGTTDMEGVLSWVNIIMAVKRASLTPIEELLNIYSSSYRDLAEFIFSGTVLSPANMNTTELSVLEDLLFRGVLDTKELIDIDKLEATTNRTIKSKARPVNTLLFQFKQANNLEG